MYFIYYNNFFIIINYNIYLHINQYYFIKTKIFRNRLTNRLQYCIIKSINKSYKGESPC